jgi:hypothetical protein
MHGLTCILWANLTSFSLQLAYAVAIEVAHAGLPGGQFQLVLATSSASVCGSLPADKGLMLGPEVLAVLAGRQGPDARARGPNSGG